MYQLINFYIVLGYYFGGLAYRTTPAAETIKTAFGTFLLVT